MKTSKRKRSAKAQPVIEAVGADVIAAEMGVVAEPALEAVAEPVAELSPAALELGSDVVSEVVDAAVELAAEEVVAAEAVVTEPLADVSDEQAAEPLADGSIEQVAEVVVEAAIEPVVEAVAEPVDTVVAEAAAEPAVVGEPIVVLASNCSVKDAAALKTSLCVFSNHGDAVTLDVSAVERVDTATMQLLCAFVRDRSGRNQSVTWRGESAALQDAVRLLGVGALLGLETKGVAA